MTDMIAELRRLYEAAPQGKWSVQGVNLHGYRICCGGEDGWIPALTDTMESADLIVAMHEALPRLLDAVETERNFHRFLRSDESESVASLSDPDWWIEHNRLMSARDAALAALDRSDG